MSVEESKTKIDRYMEESKMNMMKYCDFHTHSTRSDGELTRDKLIESAIKCNISALAITDHNIGFDDLDEMQKKYSGIKLINGAEVSTSYKLADTGELREIHIIALNFKNTDRFTKLLYDNRFDSEEYVNEIIKSLNKVGIDADFSYRDLKDKLNQEFIGRMAIARELVERKLVGSIDEVFDEYIGDFGNKRAYVKPYVSKYISMESAIHEIKKANGIAILCHPLSYQFTDEQLIHLVSDFKHNGGIAIESNYAIYNENQRNYVKELSRKFSLVESAASDFHGRGLKNTLDNSFPISIYYALKEFFE